MKNADNLVKVFVGTETAALLLKGRLEEIGVNTLIKDVPDMPFELIRLFYSYIRKMPNVQFTSFSCWIFNIL
jgi:hypothetical protein